MTAPAPEDAVVSTAGVSSQVWDGGEVVGHVLLLDLDGAGLVDAVQVADDLDGVSAVLESSERSFHVWSLAVRSLREQSLTALSYSDVDDAHVGASWRRGYAVLRVAAKVDADGEQYKTAPKVLHVSPAGAEAGHSAAHAALLRSLASDQAATPSGDQSALRPSEAPEGVDYVGDDDDVRLDHYQTLTDEGKAALSGDSP